MLNKSKQIAELEKENLKLKKELAELKESHKLKSIVFDYWKNKADKAIKQNENQLNTIIFLCSFADSQKKKYLKAYAVAEELKIKNNELKEKNEVLGKAETTEVEEMLKKLAEDYES